MEQITERIREVGQKLLQDKTVGLIIGYGRGWDDGVTAPCFVEDPSQAKQLIYDSSCSHNLAKYLVGIEGYLTSRFRERGERPRVALVAHPATMRALVVLIQEKQFKREDLVLLGISDGTLVDLEPDIVVGSVPEDRARQERTEALLRELGGMSSAERRDYWDREFGKCIRCYACRQVCPFCYCEQCIADENQPQWIWRSPTVANNRVWNAIRAYHLVGRCVDCGECERVCPVEIPLSALNNRLREGLEETFGYAAGTDTKVTSPLLTHATDDPEDLSL